MNIIVMKWDSDLGNCIEMFKDLSNIDSIEFSNFQATNIINMNKMFYGNETQEKIQKSNIFMIGAGATGCEFLKNFAMMG